MDLLALCVCVRRSYSCLPECLSWSVLDCWPSSSRKSLQCLWGTHCRDTLAHNVLRDTRCKHIFQRWTMGFGVCSQPSLISLFDLFFVIQLLLTADKGQIPGWLKGHMDENIFLIWNNRLKGKKDVCFLPLSHGARDEARILPLINVWSVLQSIKYVLCMSGLFMKLLHLSQNQNEQRRCVTSENWKYNEHLRCLDTHLWDTHDFFLTNHWYKVCLIIQKRIKINNNNVKDNKKYI